MVSSKDMSSAKSSVEVITTDPSDSRIRKSPAPINGLAGSNHCETLIRKSPVPVNELAGSNHSETLVRR
jgi:hypothetical protein